MAGSATRTDMPASPSGTAGGWPSSGEPGRGVAEGSGPALAWLGATVTFGSHSFDPGVA